jgi:hypothetical protein
MPRIITIILAIIICKSSYAQVSISNKDANIFLSQYINPLSLSIGATLNNGWYNTAKPHKLAGFDLSLSLNTLIIPKNKKSFNPNDLENFSSTSSETPTILGKGDGAIITYQGNDIKLPNQNNAIYALAMPTINTGIGIIKKTEINARYMPTYNFNAGFAGKGEISLWGIGFKHDILQWIPVIGNTIPLSLSIQGAYSSLNSKLTILNQDVDLNIHAYNINLIASRKILMLTGFAGVGFNSTESTFITNLSQEFNLGELSIISPIELVLERETYFRANVGLRFNIAVLALQANYTISEYPVLTIGAGVSIR